MRRSVLIGAIVGTFAAHASLQPSSQQTTRPRAQPLEPGAHVVRNLRPGELHAYEVTLLPGQYAGAVVEQLGIDVRVKLVQPDGHASIDIDRATGTRGLEPVVWIAEAAGRYRLEVGAVRQEAPAGRYEIRLIERRSAADADAARIAGQEAFATAARLVRENNKASLAAAVQALEQAIAHAQSVGDLADEATALMKLSEASITVGDVKASVSHGEHAVSLFDGLGDRFNEALALLRTGEAHRFSGDFLEALQRYQRALRFMREVGDAEGTGEALADVGEAYLVLHDLQQALEYDYQALPFIRASGRREDLAAILSNIGVVFRNLGETERALESYREALPMARAAKQTNLEATILDNIGVAYLNLHEPAKALSSFTEALPLRRTLGNRRGEALSLDNIATSYRDLHQPDQALEYAGQSLRLLEAVGDTYKQAMVIRNFGDINYNLGRLDAALDYQTRALALYAASGDRFEQADTLRNIAAVKRDRHEFAEARADIEKAIELSDFVRSHAGTEERRASYSAMTTGHYDLYVDLLMQMHAADPAAHYDWEAFRMSERARARSLIELLSESYADIREGVEPALLTRENALGQQLTAELDGLTRLLTSAHTSAQQTAAERRVASLEDEYRRVQADIRVRSPRYAALTQPDVLSVPEVQNQVVDGDTILLEYRLGTPHSYLWAVTTGRVSSYELPPRADIESRARQLYELLTTRQGQKGLKEGLAALSRILLDPVASELGTKRLVVVADGTLQFLPFSALPAPGGEAPLVATHEIVSAPSASTLAVMQRELAGRAPAPRSVAVLADPVFSRDDARVKLAVAQRNPGGPAAGLSPLDRAARSAGATGGTLRRLLSSRDEAEAIFAAVPDSLVLKALDFQANRSLAMSADLGRYRIVHFATHGLFDSAHPDLSGLALSLVDESGGAQDGYLRLHEIYNLKLNADLVVLSACQTALGRDVRGEGLIGLTRGFMYAGARRVVASLWEVDDAASARLMKTFYQGMLHSNLSPAAALRAAQLDVMTRKQWQSPYYWSAFTLQGDWR
jgi:CHAT domain-containing protein/tetratricopeptide (TPR) repeat protein